MSGFDDGISNSGGPGSAAEPSMEEILASIRRILKEDEANPATAGESEDDVLLLDDSMLARPADLSSATQLPPAEESVETLSAPPATHYHEAMHLQAEPGIFMNDFSAADDNFTLPDHNDNSQTSNTEDQMSDSVHPPHGIMSNEASDAAASSIGALVRSISQERQVAVSRGGITIEDIVREEIRPILKAWLDSHLPSLVERIVRSEIERVVDRGIS